MAKCNKCGKDVTCYGFFINLYPPHGFPHDTEKILCDRCGDKFRKYMAKCYDKFFKAESEDKE